MFKTNNTHKPLFTKTSVTGTDEDQMMNLEH